MSASLASKPFAYLGGILATDLVQIADLTSDRQVLERGGWWAVLATYEGRITGYRFAEVRSGPMPAADRPWCGPEPSGWHSSINEADYLDGVRRIREYIAAGEVYQVNLCRMLSAPLDSTGDPLALAGLLATGNPAPYQGVLRLPDEWVVTASPELFLSRDGDIVSSSPIKGTTRPAEPFADKDFPENIMITDLVRNDLGRIGRPGSVIVTGLLQRAEHPGLAHLVSTVQARLADGVDWQQIFSATFPPGSVTGAPKIRAQQVISELEPVPRGPYCGAIGFIDADAKRARLAVGIRTFFTSADRRLLNFGTGAGITYPSDPAAEWTETELKAARLISLASGRASTKDHGR